MPTDHHKFHFRKDKKRKSIQETTIEQLLQQIESEVRKTDEQTNLQSLKFYSDELDQFTSDIPTCNQKRKEKILDQIKKQNPLITSCPSTNIKEPKPKKWRRSVILIATILLLLMGGFSIVAIAQGGYSEAWHYIVSKLKPGESVEVDGITIVKPYGTEKFDSIEEYIEKENLNILYPSYLPEGIHIKQITEIEEGDGKICLFFQFSSYDLNFRICNYQATQAESMISPLEYQTEYTKFYIQKMSDGTYISVGYLNEYEYYVSTKNYEELIRILNHMKGLEK